MATVSNNDIAKAIYAVSYNKTGNDLSVSLNNVTKFLARKRLLSQAPDILLRLKKINNKENGIIMAKVISAEKLSEKTKQELIQILKKRYGALEVNLIENLDNKLLGGIRIEVNDEVIDLSIKNKIRRLQEYLIRNV